MNTAAAALLPAAPPNAPPEKAGMRMRREWAPADPGHSPSSCCSCPVALGQPICRRESVSAGSGWCFPAPLPPERSREVAAVS